MSPRAIVFGSPSDPQFLFERTHRSLVSRGFQSESIFFARGEENLPELDRFAATLAPGTTLDPNNGVLLLRCGSWLASQSLKLPPSSATGKPLIALGAVRNTRDPTSHPSEPSDQWRKVLESTGGDFQSLPARELISSMIFSLWIDSCLLPDFIGRANAVGVSKALQESWLTSVARRIHWTSFDLHHDTRLRVAQWITSLQRGGAERIAVDLHRSWLRNAQLNPILVALNSPSRSPFETPPATVELCKLGLYKDRWTRGLSLMEQFAPDVVHTHLLNQPDHQKLRAAVNSPVLATIHNARAGWQPGTEHLRTTEVDLVIACSMAVERELTESSLSVPTRTVWNGIDLSHFQSCRVNRMAIRQAVCDRHQIPANALIVAALANPRPQKRLERIPAILDHAEKLLRLSGDSRHIYLLIAGEPSQGNQAADQSMQLLTDAITSLNRNDRTIWLGAVDSVSDLLPAADAVLSPSDYEGLSLAHLESLACGTPVIATDVGGTSEIGCGSDGVYVVEAQANDRKIAAKLVESLLAPAHQLEKSWQLLERNFSLVRMRENYLRFYQRLAGRSQKQPRGLLLITNNFSTGGAQSSARRLLLSLKERNIPVRAVVLQEEPGNLTPGTRWLTECGISVQSLPPAGNIDPWVALQPMFESVDRSPPEAILLWNVIPEYKLLIVDSLWYAKTYDVSPGEMNMQSLDRYFARPRPGLPYRTPRDYGRRLSGAIVKYADEKPAVQSAFATPVAVIPNGVPIPSETIVQKEHGCVVFGTTVRISPQKKLEQLLEAFHLVHDRMPRYELRIAGGAERGSEDYFLQLQKQSQGLSIHWLGEQTDVLGFLSHLDLFVMISEPAGCPNASLEAMSVGLPIIATDFGGACEQVIDGHNGRLVPRNDAQALGAAIIQLASSPDIRVQLGAASRQRCIEQFSIDHMTSDYIRQLALGTN